MIDESKRSLRARKNPKYLNSDEQDPDKVSFSQLKSHHDYSSAHYQKTQDAKALVKMINKINKIYRTYRTQVIPHKIETQKREASHKDKKAEVQPETNRKANTATKEIKGQTVKKNKTTSNFKRQFSVVKQTQTAKNTESYISKLKQMGSIPIVSGIGKGMYTDQLKKLQSLYPDMKNINYQTLTQNTNPNLFSGSVTPQEKAKKQAPARNFFQEQKLFKRSSYHVAIAYHIYLKNLKAKGGSIGNEIDPTYYARKLKMNRPQQ